MKNSFVWCCFSAISANPWRYFSLIDKNAALAEAGAAMFMNKRFYFSFTKITVSTSAITIIMVPPR